MKASEKKEEPRLVSEVEYPTSSSRIQLSEDRLFERAAQAARGTQQRRKEAAQHLRSSSSALASSNIRSLKWTADQPHRCKHPALENRTGRRCADTFLKESARVVIYVSTHMSDPTRSQEEKVQERDTTATLGGCGVPCGPWLG
eukprot:6462309-Amphidinium_carterae.1